MARAKGAGGGDGLHHDDHEASKITMK